MKRLIENLITTNSTLRGKLTVWLMVSSLLIFVSLLSVFAFLTYSSLHSQIDHHIHIVITEAREIVQNFPRENREELLTRLVSAQGMTVTLLSPDGAPLVQTTSPDVAVMSEHNIQQIVANSDFSNREPQHFTVEGMRFAAVPVTVSGGRGVLAVGYSMDIIQETLARIFVVGAVIMVFLLIPLLFIGLRYLTRQLSPLEKVAMSLESITGGRDLSLRADTQDMTRELKSITQAINRLLTRLQNVFEKEQEFFSDTAHTLKTPLAALRSEIENEPKPKSQLLAKIDQISDTVQDLLLISKTQATELVTKDISLSQLMRELVDLADTLGQEKNIVVEADIEPKLRMRANRSLLARAIGNLVQNAVTYSRKNDHIRIELAENDEAFTLRIKDTGRGIPSKDLEHVFDRFYRASPDVAGTGLGLSISKAVIEAHGGTIEIASTLHEGTTVSIYF